MPGKSPLCIPVCWCPRASCGTGKAKADWDTCHPHPPPSVAMECWHLPPDIRVSGSSARFCPLRWDTGHLGAKRCSGGQTLCMIKVKCPSIRNGNKPVTSRLFATCCLNSRATKEKPMSCEALQQEGQTRRVRAHPLGPSRLRGPSDPLPSPCLAGLPSGTTSCSFRAPGDAMRTSPQRSAWPSQLHTLVPSRLR